MALLRTLSVVAGLILFLAGENVRAEEAQVVLLPEADGGVGRLSVEAGGETVVLDQPYEGTKIRGEGPPQHPQIWDQKKIRRIFQSALDIRPLLPVRYILHFESGTAVLSPASRRKIPDILAGIRGRPQAEIVVSGHTDRVGDAGENKELGLARARQMQALLVTAGVSAGRISIESHGEGNPLIPTGDGVAAPGNRRAEVVIR